MFYKIYCDGAASNNGYENAIGGWAFVVLDKDENVVLERAEMVKGATNNRMELYAAYMGLSSLLEEKQDVEEIEVYTDSAYLHNCITQKWYENWMKNGWRNAKKEPVANKNLWEHLVPFFVEPRVKFFKVKGHDGDKWNEYVDDLAVAARLKMEEEDESNNN
jgi:ribonuclease HI